MKKPLLAALACLLLPALAAALDDWMRTEDEEHAAAYNVAFLPPAFAFLAEGGGFSGAEEGGLGQGVYSLSGGAVTALDGEYAGSREYGAVSILFPQGGGGWFIALDD